MKRLILLPLTLLGIYCNPATAFPTREVFSGRAQGIDGSIIELEIYPGDPFTINFSRTGETVKQVMAGDPSRFTYGGVDGVLCPLTVRESCTSTGTKVVFIKQIYPPLEFPNQSHSADGSTQLKIYTESDRGIKEYIFKLIPVSVGVKTTSSYSSLIINPDSSKPQPLLLKSK
ncbi:MAG: hypothetical protein CLLPBCKN_007220 [Chroococcidiopsis cubana SAG 39.79]|uniref:Uncharacterized protein n=1 Tax=Chroococcidiopsis cubana SAG 39.79 TaxID=388085 RepID=A0AB37URI4_9CYAN|nr:hypothetical protein [Chroococcidiopsis cubana]MDZ4877785.1 hypothetical protein [Chroococcidiopsis cubana SAG 39.79]PSB66619.1 hypothetical protein C7B79_00180 [Chroococcidiopsis cubana CCALA 043]PSB66648.1 hypothetical protein C7B79_00325 [Chroococcidiopsis cubana CCALA 043]RUT14065.1 hypothetical protein DSM107010_05480 [Chroococcidiopsis cubana SAG 39.79]